MFRELKIGLTVPVMALAICTGALAMGKGGGKPPKDPPPPEPTMVSCPSDFPAFAYVTLDRATKRKDPDTTRVFLANRAGDCSAMIAESKSGGNIKNPADPVIGMGDFYYDPTEPLGQSEALIAWSNPAGTELWVAEFVPFLDLTTGEIGIPLPLDPRLVFAFDQDFTALIDMNFSPDGAKLAVWKEWLDLPSGEWRDAIDIIDLGAPGCDTNPADCTFDRVLLIEDSSRFTEMAWGREAYESGVSRIYFTGEEVIGGEMFKALLMTEKDPNDPAPVWSAPVTVAMAEMPLDMNNDGNRYRGPASYWDGVLGDLVAVNFGPSGDGSPIQILDVEACLTGGQCVVGEPMLGDKPSWFGFDGGVVPPLLGGVSGAGGTLDQSLWEIDPITPSAMEMGITGVLWGADTRY